MRTITEFPHAVEMHDDVSIPMTDGVKLAARIWRPVGSERKPVPAILEFLPYRRRDGTFFFEGAGTQGTYGPVTLRLDGRIERPTSTFVSGS